MIFRGIGALAAGIFTLSALLQTACQPLRAQSVPTSQQWEGQPTIAVQVLGDAGSVFETNPQGLALQPGQPFSMEAERESLRELFRSGRYSDLVARITPVEGGVRLDFIAVPTYYVNNVVVNGLPDPPSSSAVLSALRLNLGEPFRESDMGQALDRLRQALEDEGLYQTKLTYMLMPRPATRQMDIVIQGLAHPRARAGTVTLVDDTSFPEDALRSRLKLKTGTQITTERINQSIERARNWLVDRGYLGARVTVTRGDYNAETDEVPLTVRAIAGRNIDVHIEGTSISSKILKRLLPIYAEGAVDDDLLQEGRRSLRDYLQGEGFFDAQVDYTTSGIATAEEIVRTNPPPRADDVATITYDITLGPRHRLMGFSIEGNRYFDADTLRGRVSIQPAAFASRGRFSMAMLDNDVASLQDIYRANGFRDAKVTSGLVSNYKGRPDDIFVNFKIDEGRQTLVAALQLEGNRIVSDDVLLGVIASSPGQPFSDFNVTTDRDNILALYYDRGFPEARMTATAQDAPSDANGAPRASVLFKIEEGPPLRVADVLVDGYGHTRRGIIERHVELRPGQPLSESSVVETQRRLYDLGVFSRVSIAPQNPEGIQTDKNVVVLVDEARRYTIGYGGGVEAQRFGGSGSGPAGGDFNISPRAIFQFSKLNVTGRADSLSFRARASTIQGRGLLTYTSPEYFGARNLSFQLSGLFDKSRDVLTFTSTRYEGSGQILYHVTLPVSIAFRYSYRHIVASDLQVSPQQIPLYSQPTRVSLFGITVARDRRDNAADPGHGSFNTFSADVAERTIGSSATFLRVFMQNSTYTPFARRLLFARSTRFGIISPFSGSLSTDIPLPEKFFAGGGATLRGFGLNQAGPRDPLTGFPIGGLSSLVFNQEIRFPMRLPWIGNRAGGGLFYDAGNVFSRFGTISLRASPPKPVFDPAQPTICVINCSNELSYFSHTVGFSLRYNTPIGPVTVDLGYQLNPAQFLVPLATVPAGQPTPLTLQRLSSFQFFINLGSTF